MATRFYLPASGTAPLGSLAIDASWGRSENLERRPCGTVKSDTSLTQKSATWAATATNDWCWAQFQSKRLADAYSWTTSDTVSMVIKVAEAAAQVDSHLAYCIRVVSADGTTVRGTIGVYQATSTEYPTSLAAIATRIHNARTDGASNFSSQAGDRIIIELGHWGVTPTANVVYHNYGDPSATQDFALVADDTNDYCPWVELSQTIDFDMRTTKPAYMKGVATGSATNSAYTQGANPSTPASDTNPAYTKGVATTSNTKPVYTKGVSTGSDANPAYTKGAYSGSDTNPAYMKGVATGNASHEVYVQGMAVLSDTQSVFMQAWTTTQSNKPAFTWGQTIADASHGVYIEGYSSSGSGSDSVPAFIIGIDAVLLPDGDVSSAGTWKDELGGGTDIYNSINESRPNYNDYIYDNDPTTDDYYECSLTNPASTPGVGDVVVFWAGRDSAGSGTMQATVQLRQGATIIASSIQVLSSIARTYYFTLTPAEKANITDWNDLRVRIIVTQV